MFSKITVALTTTYFFVASIVITPALAADLFSYRNDGLGAVAHIAGGTLQQTQSIPGMTPGWSQIVSTR